MSAVLNRGDYVAIMPALTAPASEVLEIASILLAGSVYVQLLDAAHVRNHWRPFAQHKGNGLHCSGDGRALGGAAVETA